MVRPISRQRGGLAPLKLTKLFGIDHFPAAKDSGKVFIIIIYMLLAGWEVRIGKNCDRGLENAARGRRSRAAFSSPRSQFFPIRTDPKATNNIFIFFFLP